MVRALKECDIAELLDIYNHYVLNSVATFDDEILSFETFKNKIDRINAEFPFLVYEEGNEVLGFAYASKFRPKPAYKNTLELTVYVKQSAFRKGIGFKLYTALISILKKSEFHTVIAVLTLPNVASEKLHEKFGFKKVAHFTEVGFKFNKWHDVCMYQLVLN